jgi:hypothetical protein
VVFVIACILTNWTRIRYFNGDANDVKWRRTVTVTVCLVVWESILIWLDCIILYDSCYPLSMGLCLCLHPSRLSDDTPKNSIKESDTSSCGMLSYFLRRKPTYVACWIDLSIHMCMSSPDTCGLVGLNIRFITCKAVCLFKICETRKRMDLLRNRLDAWSRSNNRKTALFISLLPII